MQLNFKTEQFEGPLDLLLALVAKHKMNILDIEIITIINQYLEIINAAQAQDLEVASDFIDMAARLVYLKSVYLLPKDDEGEKLKAELQGQLIEYSQAKLAAENLRRMYVGDMLFIRQPAEIEEDWTYDIIHPVSDLVKAYEVLDDKSIRRAPPKVEKFEPIVSAPMVSVHVKIFSVLKNLMKNRVQSLQSAFDKTKGKSDAIATFMAILELIRAHRIEIDQDENMVLSKKHRGN
ncbi:MAG: segregation/condensation protein A [Oscillospiraceae bacterium]|nr:segregation/condensation protein A [Oscillospiraceae bacterium]